MLARCYYYTVVKRLRSDVALRIMSTREFFVMERTIANALLKNDSELKKMLADKPNTNELSKRYPMFYWSV